MSEPRAQEWPPLSDCICGARWARGRAAFDDGYAEVWCEACDREVYGETMAEAAALWNAYSNLRDPAALAKGEKEAESAD